MFRRLMFHATRGLALKPPAGHAATEVNPSCFPFLQSHPGTNVTVIDLFDRSASLQPMWKQVEGFKAAIYPIMQNAADGVHFICYSQGQ